MVTTSFLEFAKYISTDRLKFCFFCLHYTYSNSVSDFKCGVTYQWIQLFLKTFSFLNGHCVITNWSLPLVVIKDEWLWRKFQCSCGRSNNIVGTRLQLEIIQSFCFKLCPKYGPDCSQKWNIANERTRFSCQCNSTCEGSLGCVLLPRRVKKKKQRQVNLTKGLRDCAKLTNDVIWWKMSKQKASWRMLIGLSLKQQELKDIK